MLNFSHSRNVLALCGDRGPGGPCRGYCTSFSISVGYNCIHVVRTQVIVMSGFVYETQTINNNNK